MCDSWIGADYAIALPLTAIEPTRAQKEGRAPRATDKKKIVRSEESEDMIAEQKKDEEQEASDTEEIAPDEDAEDDSDDESDLWDSDEYGTEESGSDSETESHHDSS
jgi:translocation protein SEC63